MDLVTVTCNRDFNSMLLQARSIQKFLFPGGTHWIMINEPHDSLYKYDWEKSLSLYYEKHNLKIVYCDPIHWNYSSDGWIIQQVLKFLSLQLINNDYLILDSKNFLVKPVDLNSWTHDGCGILISKKINEEVWNKWRSTNLSYAKILKLPGLQCYYAPETPYIFRKNIVQKIIDKEDFGKWFVTLHRNFFCSEFIFYSFFLRNERHIFKYVRRHGCIWPSIKNIREWFKTDYSNNIEILGIHRTWLKNCSAEDKEFLKNWLSSIDLIDENTIKIFE